LSPAQFSLQIRRAALATHRTKAVRKEAGRYSFEPLFYQSSRGGESVGCEKSPKAMILIPDETDSLQLPFTGTASLRSHQATLKHNSNDHMNTNNTTASTSLDSAEFFINMRHKKLSGYAGSLALTTLLNAGILSVKTDGYGRGAPNWQQVDPKNVSIDFAKLKDMIADDSILQLRNMGKKGLNLICMHLGIAKICVVKGYKPLIPRCECCGQRLPVSMRK
jgi:hypothetical protein